MTLPLVSVVLPVFDGERFLEAAIESVLAQDYEPFEVIVVDDGSTDGSGDIARSHPGVRVLEQENRGDAAARNAGVRAARGEILAFCDHDDLLPPDKLAVQVGHLLSNPSVGCVLGRMRTSLEPGVEPPPWLGRDRWFGEVGGIPAMSMVTWTRVMRRVGEFDPRLPSGSDLDWLIRARARGVEISFLPQVVLYRRIHQANMTHRSGEDRVGVIPSLAEHIHRLREGVDGESARGPRDRPLVSVVMPVHNGGAYLGEAIESVRLQTYRPLEVVVVDDGSTDDTSLVVRGFHPLAHYVWQPHAGIGAARNRGVGEARGALIAFLDADDGMPPDRIERQAAILAAEPSTDAVFGQVREFVSPELRATPGLRPAMGPLELRSSVTMLIRRAALERVGPYSPTAAGAVEVEWRARALEADLREALLDRVVLERRLHMGNYGRHHPEARAEILSVLKAALDRRRESGPDAHRPSPSRATGRGG